LPDNVEHESTGYLARPYEIDDLAHGLIASIDNSRSSGSWGAAAHEHAHRTWAPERVVRRYLEAYERVLS
jgi:glycosyltransferase involved in cell wall biosynthesis